MLLEKRGIPVFHRALGGFPVKKAMFGRFPRVNAYTGCTDGVLGLI